MDIGKTTLKYDRKGVLNEVLFTPLLETKLTGEEIKRLFTVEGNTEPTIKDNASMIFATWLQALTNIELANREDYELVTETVDCLTYKNKKVKRIELLLSFKKKTMKRNFDTVRTEYGLGFPEKAHEHPTKAIVRKHLPEKVNAASEDHKKTSLLDMDYSKMDVSAALVRMWYEKVQK